MDTDTAALTAETGILPSRSQRMSAALSLPGEGRP